MRKLFTYAVILSPVLLAFIFVLGFVAPWLWIRGFLAEIIGYLFIACSVVGFFGSIALAISNRRLLWLIATISTTLLFFLNLLMSAGLATSRMH